MTEQLDASARQRLQHEMAVRTAESVFPRLRFAVRQEGSQCWVDHLDDDMKPVSTRPGTPEEATMFGFIERAREELIALIASKGTELFLALEKITAWEQAFAASLRFAPELAKEATAGARVSAFKRIIREQEALGVAVAPVLGSGANASKEGGQ